MLRIYFENLEWSDEKSAYKKNMDESLENRGMDFSRDFFSFDHFDTSCQAPFSPK
jgi:hypothetical protein